MTIRSNSHDMSVYDRKSVSVQQARALRRRPSIRYCLLHRNKCSRECVTKVCRPVKIVSRPRNDCYHLADVSRLPTRAFIQGLTRAPRLNAHAFLSAVIRVARLSVIVAEGLVLFLTWAKTVDLRREASRMHMRVTLATLLIRDGRPLHLVPDNTKSLTYLFRTPRRNNTVLVSRPFLFTSRRTGTNLLF